MILIADSGSTKTDWRIMAADREIGQVKTKGFNPYYQADDEMIAEIESALVPALEKFSFSKIYFYGAGCSTHERQLKISNALSPFFNDSSIYA